VPELIANRYRINCPLESGATAFQAFDLQLTRTVVIKTLPQRVREQRLARQFLQEAKAAARLTHPNLVGIYDVYENGASDQAKRPNGPDPFVVMEWVSGSNLRAYLSGREPLPSEEVDDPFERKLDLLVQVCRALQYGHEQGLIHRSLTPENIRVTPGREAKILNFGITPFRKTNSRWLYCSPEQLEGHADLDRRSDIFNLGIILYELLFGTHPFGGETEEGTKSRILASQYSPVDDLLPGAASQLTEIVQRSLARDPDARFADCSLLETELKALRNGLEQEKEECRSRLISIRTALKKDTRSRHPADSSLYDLALLESADPNSEEYEHLLRSCKELGGVVERLQRQAQSHDAIDAAEQEANTGGLEAASARIAEVLRTDPGNPGALAAEEKIQRRKQVRTLLGEARQAEAAQDVGLACVLALQAVQLDPEATDARAEFDRMQTILRQRKEESLALSRTADVEPVISLGLRRRAPAFDQPPTTAFTRRPLVRGVAILALLLLLGVGWVAVTRNGPGASPVSARNAPAQPKPETPGPTTAPREAIVSLDVVPWANVVSIIDLSNGRPVSHGYLESPCTFRLHPGRYAITVSHPEFGSRLVPVEVREGITNEVRVSLLSKPELEKEIQVGGR